MVDDMIAQEFNDVIGAIGGGVVSLNCLNCSSVNHPANSKNRFSGSVSMINQPTKRKNRFSDRASQLKVENSNKPLNKKYYEVYISER